MRDWRRLRSALVLTLTAKKVNLSTNLFSRYLQQDILGKKSSRKKDNEINSAAKLSINNDIFSSAFKKALSEPFQFLIDGEDENTQLNLPTDLPSSDDKSKDWIENEKLDDLQGKRASTPVISKTKPTKSKNINIDDFNLSDYDFSFDNLEDKINANFLKNGLDELDGFMGMEELDGILNENSGGAGVGIGRSSSNNLNMNRERSLFTGGFERDEENDDIADDEIEINLDSELREMGMRDFTKDIMDDRLDENDPDPDIQTLEMLLNFETLMAEAENKKKNSDNLKVDDDVELNSDGSTTNHVNNNDQIGGESVESGRKLKGRGTIRGSVDESLPMAPQAQQLSRAIKEGIEGGGVQELRSTNGKAGATNRAKPSRSPPPSTPSYNLRSSLSSNSNLEDLERELFDFNNREVSPGASPPVGGMGGSGGSTGRGSESNRNGLRRRLSSESVEEDEEEEDEDEEGGLDNDDGEEPIFDFMNWEDMDEFEDQPDFDDDERDEDGDEDEEDEDEDYGASSPGVMSDRTYQISASNKALDRDRDRDRDIMGIEIDEEGTYFSAHHRCIL